MIAGLVLTFDDWSFQGPSTYSFFASFDRSVYLLFWTSYRPELIVCKGGLVCAHSNYGVIYGLRTLNEAFHWTPEFLCLGRQIGQINFGAFGVFWAKPMLVQWVPCPCFPLFNHYFYKIFGIEIWIWAAKT